MDSICKDKFAIPEGISEELKDLLLHVSSASNCRFWRKTPKNRFSIKDITNHLWLDDFSEPDEIGFRLGK